MSQVNTYTFSALTDILSDSFAVCRTPKFPACGDYYYSEIKCNKWEKRSIKVLRYDLEVLNGKIDNLTIIEKKKLITESLKSFADRNYPDTDAESLCKDMRWIIV